MRILIISQYYWPETFAAGIYLRELAEHLVSQGHHITVQTAFPHYPEGVVWADYRGKLAMSEKRNDITIRRSFIWAVPRARPLVFRALAPLTFALSAFISSLFNGRHDVIYVLYPILPLGFAALLLGKIKHCPVVLGVKDLSIEGLLQAGKLKPGLVLRSLEGLERRLYKQSSHIQVPTTNQERYLLGWGVPAGKIAMIPDWVDPAAITPLSKENGFRRKHGLDGKFVVLYSGNMGYSSELDTVLAAAKRLAHVVDIVFVLIGDGVKRSDLERQAGEAQLRNVSFLPFQPRDQFPEVLAAADIGLITLNRKFTTVASQGKMYSIMSAERPIFAVMEKEAWGAGWIDEKALGKRVDPGNDEELAQAILEWRARPDDLLAAGARGRRFLEERFTVQTCGAAFVALFEHVHTMACRKPAP